MNDLLDENEWLVKLVAKKFYNVEKEDLYQAGRLGLIKAIKKYNNPEIKFSSYAYKYVFGEMYDLSVKSRDIKLNKYYLKLYKLIVKTKSMLTQKLEREVTLNDISAYLDIDISEIENVVMITEDMLSLDDEYANIQVGVEENSFDEIIVDDILNSLDPLSSAVISYRVKDDLTQSEIAKLLGISQVKVSRIESKSKNKILEYIN